MTQISSTLDDNLETARWLRRTDDDLWRHDATASPSRRNSYAAHNPRTQQHTLETIYILHSSRQRFQQCSHNHHASTPGGKSHHLGTIWRQDLFELVRK